MDPLPVIQSISRSGYYDRRPTRTFPTAHVITLTSVATSGGGRDPGSYDPRFLNKKKRKESSGGERTLVWYIIQRYPKERLSYPVYAYDNSQQIVSVCVPNAARFDLGGVAARKPVATDNCDFREFRIFHL